MSEHNQKAVKNTLVMKKSELVNGYALFSTSNEVFIEPYYKQMIAMWLDEINGRNLILEKFTPIIGRTLLNFLDSFIEFEKICKLEMCTDWYKQDAHGECFAGFWRFPENSIEYTNASEMSYRKNVLCLFKLPYPIRLLLETVEIGCSNRAESVRYSNFLCEWLYRKYQILNHKPIPTRIPYLDSDFDEKRYIYEGFIEDNLLNSQINF